MDFQFLFLPDDESLILLADLDLSQHFQYRFYFL